MADRRHPPVPRAANERVARLRQRAEGACRWHRASDLGRGQLLPGEHDLTTAAALSAEDALLVALRSSLPDVLAKVLAQQVPAATPPGQRPRAGRVTLSVSQRAAGGTRAGSVDDLRQGTVCQADRGPAGGVSDGGRGGARLAGRGGRAQPPGVLRSARRRRRPERCSTAPIRIALPWTPMPWCFPRAPTRRRRCSKNSPAIRSPRRSAGAADSPRSGTTCKATVRRAPAISPFPSPTPGGRSAPTPLTWPVAGSASHRPMRSRRDTRSRHRPAGSTTAAAASLLPLFTNRTMGPPI